MKKKILIFTATYNESETLKFFFEEIYKLKFEFDLLIIDDNSPDLTWKKLKDLEKIHNNFKLIIRDKKLGLDTAHKRAFLVTVDSIAMKKKLKEIINVVSQGIKINIIGEISKLPSNVKKILRDTIKKTKKNNKIVVNLAINYGSKNEIINAFKKTKKINLKNFEKNLYTKNIPDPEILIRTGGHYRLSNFMLWQLAYAELFFVKKLWPDFNAKDFNNIIKKYKKIKRNFGSI